MIRRKAGSASEGSVQGTIGAHLRALRKQRRMTLEQLSEATGISVSSLSRIENTQLGLTIEKVETLARALGVTAEAFVSRAPPGGAAAASAPAALRFTVDRASERQAARYRELSIEYLFERCAARSLDCMHLIVQAVSIWESEFVRHPGEKIIYVIAGAALVYCEKRPPLVLETGDSLYMDAPAWHTVVGVNGQPAEILVTVLPGPDSRGRPFETQTFTPESWAALQAT
ncbi:helix-turn-helix domain-containing protein [Sphingosinicella terrae]|uniref:helix-turn-helix domain-containing protein n=1 Tax=Sphingosinicella terrae TaxID=2172047 RepID=UPI0013B3F9EC|nr:XRE family transcriptional regulator [Sphingosinicella terrae]